jgi:signal peptidase
VTHRIASITPQPGGARVFRTKGDANPVVDPWTFTLQNRTQARAAFHLPFAGFALAALADRRLRMLLIGVPALLVALSVLAALWRDAGETAVEGRRA